MTGDFLETSRPVLAWVLRTTFEASLIAALVLMAQYLLRGRVSARWRYNLWLLVVARLLLPVVPGTQYSPFNLVRLPDAQNRQVARPAVPRLTPAAPLPAIPVPGSSEPRPRRDVYLVSDTDVSSPSEVGVRPAPATTESADAVSKPVALWTPPDVLVPDRVRNPLAAAAKPQPAPRAAQSATVTFEVPWHLRVNWLAVAGIVWVAGAAFVAARLAWVSIRLSSAVRGLRPVRDPALAQLVAECAQRLGLRRLPELLEAPDHFGPALVGLLRPRVVLPGCVLHGSFHPDELRLILMHELAHMKRWDVAANWLLAALGVLHWFNPFLLLAFRRMRVDRELACDELVLSAAHADAARAYGPTILKLLQTLSRGSQLPGMVGVLEGKQSIRRRIAMIARFDRHRRNDSPLFGIALSLLAGGIALTGAVRGQDAAPREVAVEVADDDQRDDEAREAEDAAREARDEAREAAREAQEQAREAADEARRASEEAAGEALEAARERINEIQESVAERQKEAQERAEEGERAVAEAQKQIEERQSETQREIDEAHKALAEVQQQLEQRDSELRQALEEAQRALSEQASAEKSEGDESAAEALAERERELKDAVEEREQELATAAAERDQALKEAQEQLDRAAAEQQSALQEAQAEVERAVAEQQNALQEATQAVEQAAAEQDAALQQLTAAQEALAQVGAGLAPLQELPGETPVEALAPAPVPEAPHGSPPAAGAPSPSATPAPAIEGAPAVGMAPGAAPAAPARPAPARRGGRGGTAPAVPYGAGGSGYGGFGAQPGGYPGYGGYGRAGGYGGGFPGGYPGTPAPAAGAGVGRNAAAQPAAPRGMMGGMGMPGMAPGGMPAEARVEDPAARGADARTAQALRRTLQINFDGAPLSDVLSFIADNTEVDVVGDWKSLEAAGIDRSASVSLNLRQGAPAEQVLTWVLRSAAGDAAGFAIDHGVVLVSSQDRIDRMVITRAYPLGGLAGSGSQLENLVRDTVAPHSWRESGGAGSVRFFNDKLFVTATEPNHRQVERLLGLMDAQGAQAPGAPMPGGMPPGPSRRPLGLTAPQR